MQDSKLKADNRLREADEEARRITANAEEDAAKAAREYVRQVDMKKNELEDVKRQVNAFRTSLLEMYKKHLECIDHIPVFRQKEGYPEPAAIFKSENQEKVSQTEVTMHSNSAPDLEPPARVQHTESELEQISRGRRADPDVQTEKIQPELPTFEIETVREAAPSMKAQEEKLTIEREIQQNQRILT